MNHSEGQIEPKLTGVKLSLKVMALLSVIANIILAVVFIVVLYEIWSIANGERLTLSSGTFVKSDVLLAGLFLTLTCIGSGFGAFKIFKGKRYGLIIYTIMNGLWIAVALFFGSGDPYGLVYAGFSIAFLLFFIIQRNELK